MTGNELYDKFDLPRTKGIQGRYSKILTRLSQTASRTNACKIRAPFLKLGRTLARAT